MLKKKRQKQKKKPGIIYKVNKIKSLNNISKEKLGLGAKI